MAEKRTITVEMEVRFVPVPKDQVEVWRRGIARMYEELDEMIERDRKMKEISARSSVEVPAPSLRDGAEHIHLYQ